MLREMFGILHFLGGMEVVRMNSGGSTMWLYSSRWRTAFGGSGTSMGRRFFNLLLCRCRGWFLVTLGLSGRSSAVHVEVRTSNSGSALTATYFDVEEAACKQECAFNVHDKPQLRDNSPASCSAPENNIAHAHSHKTPHLSLLRLYAATLRLETR